MVRDTWLDWKPWSVLKQSHFLVRFSVSVLVICLGFRIIYSTITSESIYSIGLLSTVISKTPSVGDAVSPPPAPSVQKTVDDAVAPPPAPSVQKTVDDAVSPPPAPSVQKTLDDAVSPPPAPSVQKTLDDAVLSPPAPSENYVELQRNKNQNHIPQKEKCDLSIGEWIPDSSGPMYNNESCSFITEDQNCIKNGRPDLGFLYWRWKPRDCELPRFNAVRFLEGMRNKHWAFVGDSISRNHVQSLLCILSKVEAVNEVYHDKGFRNRRWHFPSYNFSLTVIWSPFLVEAYVPEDMQDIRLDLDKLDNTWADQYTSFDYMVMSGGKWFLRTATYYENNTIVGCHYCPGKNLTEYGLDNAYRKALKLVIDLVLNSNHSGVLLYRTTTPDHFEYGSWNTGGKCNRTAPYKEGEASLNDMEVIFHNVELEAFKELETIEYSGKRQTLKLLNATELSLLRPDGHPGPYRRFLPLAKDKNAKDPNDCLHWCLPGPIDSWNDLVMEMVLND